MAQQSAPWITYRPQLKVLDCTIRDGGLINNHQFSDELVRAVYDAFTRHRLIYESALAEEANAKLAEAPTRGSRAAMAAATAVLRRAETEPVRRDLRERIDKLCEALFRSIALQTSMSRYKASGRGPKDDEILTRARLLADERNPARRTANFRRTLGAEWRLAATELAERRLRALSGGDFGVGFDDGLWAGR